MLAKSVLTDQNGAWSHHRLAKMDSSSNSHEVKEEELIKQFNELKTRIGLLEKSLYQLRNQIRMRNEDPDEKFLCEILNENQELQKKVRQLQNKEGEVRYENEKLKCKVKVICGEKRKLIEQMVDKHIKTRKQKLSQRADANVNQTESNFLLDSD